MFAIAGGIVIAVLLLFGLGTAFVGFSKVVAGYNRYERDEGQWLMGCGGTLLGAVFVAWLMWG